MTTKSIWQQLAEEFPKELERTYQGRAGRSFTYIEPRDVMDRLDTVLTPAGWQFEARAVNDSVAHGRLSIRVEGEWIAREDFGYPNNNADIAESLKEAQSDSLRRCAMAFGVARYLYRRDLPSTAQRPAAPRATTLNGVAAPQPPSTVYDGDEPPWPDAVAVAQETFAGLIDESKCPDHDKEWRTNKRGFYCATKVGDGWCERQPSKAWQASQELVPA